MAAPIPYCGRSGSDSESSNAEDLERFREAVWDRSRQQSAPVRPESSGGGFKKDVLPSAQLSLRQKANEHDQDVSELQTTPEFRAHVAKKLGAMLDSCITITVNSADPSWTCAHTSNSDGFRLFSSSVPGNTGKTEPSLPTRRRPHSSSSELDSDQEWKRFQEAAVSAADILKESALAVIPQDSSQAQSEENTEHSQKKRKKRKKKNRGETNGGQKVTEMTESSQTTDGTLLPVCINGGCERQEGGCIQDTSVPGVVRKKKKKTRKEKNSTHELKAVGTTEGC
uniref:Protein CUSTOS n=1 Tax=Sphenodon punctatus TaxID=8508 RepID=A0A8D0HFY8_SPHPU